MRHYLKKWSAWLLPYHCILCKEDTQRSKLLCETCEQDLPMIDFSCSRCAIPMPYATLCGTCLQDPPPYHTTHALYLYELPVTKLILELKFHQALLHANLFGKLLAEHIKTVWYLEKPLPTVIIPMPLHADRLKKRGFNQAVEIARTLASELKLPQDYASFLRVKPTQPQSTLTIQARKANLNKAFLMKKPFNHQHVAVVDDVITTGSTVREFCQLLKKAGVTTIDVWCVARAALKR